MERNTPPVKKRRPYDSARRQEQARQTRETVLDVARERFLSDGFAATTIAAVAAGARVSPDTVYKAFGGKAGLVRAIYEQSLAGTGPVHAETRSDELQTTEPDARTLIRGIGQLAAEVAPRAGPIVLLIRDAAAADPDMAALKAELDHQRLQRMTHNARNLAAAGHLREDITVEEAGQIGWIYSSPELFELLVHTLGWPPERFATFVADALTAHLLPPGMPHDAPSASRERPLPTQNLPERQSQAAGPGPEDGTDLNQAGQ